MTAHCVECGEAYNPRRRALGYRTCIAETRRKSALKQINKYSAE